MCKLGILQTPQYASAHTTIGMIISNLSEHYGYQNFQERTSDMTKSASYSNTLWYAATTRPQTTCVMIFTISSCNLAIYFLHCVVIPLHNTRSVFAPYYIIWNVDFRLHAL